MTINTIKHRKKRVGNNKPLRTSPYPSKDLTGKKINKLFVIRFEGYRPNKKGVRKCYYRCKCDCGNEVVISHQELNNGRISCGCALEYFRKNILPCCEICNKAKRDLKMEDFLEWLKRLVEFRKTL